MLVNHLDFSEQSLSWAPSNPRYKELRVRLLIMQIDYLPTNKDVLASLDQLIDLHGVAAQERPQWTFSWSSLFAMKSAEREFDQEYRQALENAFKYGPYEAARSTR